MPWNGFGEVTRYEYNFDNKGEQSFNSFELNVFN